MATRLKTVFYAFPATTTTATNNTLANLTQISITIPESGLTFRSVQARFSCDDIVTVTGGTVTTKTFGLRLGAAAYTSVANANALTNSGENVSLWWVIDYTTHFTTNWAAQATAGVATCDFQFTINQSTGTTLGMNNLCCILEITYEYDDTSTTQLKSVMIPLNAPVATVTTTATTYGTIPALDTYLPEASKSYKNIAFVVQYNTQVAGAATSSTLTINAGSATTTTGAFSGSLASDRMSRFIWNATTAYSALTGATQNFQLSSTVARHNHPQAYMIVTYTFNVSTTTSLMNSVMLPMEITAPFGGTTSADYQRGTRTLYIQEPGTITTERIAYYAFWDQQTAQAGLNMRVGTGAFVTYTDTAAVLCGGDCAMVRNDAAFTLARGSNTLSFDVYRTSATELGWGVSGFWIINYTSSSIASGGPGAHNHTIFWKISGGHGTAAATSGWTYTATAPVFPASNYWLSAFGTESIVVLGSTIAPNGQTVQVERLAAEGGVKWEEIINSFTSTDPEVGARLFYSQGGEHFKTYPNDPISGLMDIETARRWRVFVPYAGATAAQAFNNLTLIATYHTVTYTVTGTISGSAGGTVTIRLVDTATKEVVDSTTRTGDGTYSFTWYDNVNNLQVVAYEDSTHKGASIVQTASAGDFDISLASGGGSSSTYYAYM